MTDGLSPTAVLVLARVLGCREPMDGVRIARQTGVSLRVAREAVDELLINQQVRLTADGFMVRIEPPPPGVDRQPPLARAALQLSSREHWRFQQALTDPDATEDGGGIPVYGGAGAAGTIAALHRSRPKEVLSLSPAPLYQSVRAVDRPARESNISMVAAGRTYSGWVSDEARVRNPLLCKEVHALVRAGEQVFVAPEVTARFGVYDRTLAIVPIQPTDPSRGCLIVRSPTMIGHLLALYQEVRGRATPVLLPPAISTERRRILAELAAGAKDEAIARRLGLSARTIRRAVAAMMTDCGADSRFQLAIAAVRLGWLGPTDLSATPPAVRHPRDVGQPTI